MDRTAAEIRAVQILAWLAGNDDLFPVFLGSTGTDRSDLRARAESPDYLASVLDFVMMDDAWVLACARDLEMAPEEFIRVRAQLPGGDAPNWT